jgi:D-serine deaminase-like pyridoxal phosphate-dependent protein
MKLSELDTPALILDRARLEANIARMSARARDLGVDLRPHLKTAKSAEVGRLATAGHSGGVMVSTLKEAEYFAERGFKDLVYGVGIALPKLDRVAALQAKGAHVAVLTDDLEVARGIGVRAEALGAHFEVLIELDTGDGRAGVAPDSEALIEIGMALDNARGVSLRGVLTHAGHSYGCRGVAEVEEVAEAERAGAVQGAERLRAADLPCPVVSVGSTPTAMHARSLEGVSEMRPGVYVFNDVFQAEIGSCGLEDIALSVLTTVTGQQRARGELVIDAGGLALSKDRSTAAGPRDVGYGLAVDPGRPGELPELQVVRVSQEHGIVAAPGGGLPFAALPPGARLRILPNHACFTAAAYEFYHVVDSSDGAGEEVVETWDRVNGW